MAYYRLFATRIGIPWGAGLSSSFHLNAAGTWAAVSFTAPVTSTLNSVRAYIPSKNGTVNAADATINVFSTASTTYYPNSSVAGPTSCDSAITGAGWYNWTPSYAVTVGRRYHIVFKNANGTPASNNYYITTSASGLVGGLINPLATGGNMNGDLVVTTTTTSGSSWTHTGSGSIRLGFSDGTYYGFPVSSTGNDTTNRVYSTREVGTKFTLPTNLNCKVIGLGLHVHKGGTPTGVARLRLYTGSSPSLQATADMEPSTGFASGFAFSYFSSAVTLTGNTICRVVLSETTQSDTSSNYFYSSSITLDSDSNSTGLIPFSCSKTYYDGSSWTETANTLCPFLLILNDTTGDFESGSSSGGLIVPRTFTGF